MPKLIIISPSGNMYGSEKVLIDYLQTTKKCHTVYIPANSTFYFYARNNLAHKHSVRAFTSVLLLYINIFTKLLFNYNLYINEAGHVKWLALLAKAMPKRKYTIHVRLLEDTNHNRLNLKNTKNINVIAISQFISKNIIVKNEIIYDNYAFKNDIKVDKILTIKKIGIIGRVTETKGFYLAEKFIKYCLKTNLNLNFQFFGDVNNTDDKITQAVKELTQADDGKVIFNGFVSDKDAIYNNVDAIIHFNPKEPLGRIYLEAIDYFKPFFAFDYGGIAEIGKICGLSSNLIEYKESWEFELAQKISGINIESEYAKLIDARKKAMEVFSVYKYTADLEKIIL